MRYRYFLQTAALLLVTCTAGDALAQQFVRPQRAFKSRTRNFSFEWQHIDIRVMPAPDGNGQPVPEGVEVPEDQANDGGGIRLYFYERERRIAELAAVSITETYRELVGIFGYTPTRIFPYVLYNTYQEFLETNLFPAQEGVLGVTVPSDLTLTLPYFGDHRLFHDVSKHELVHQFTIQKLRTRAEAAEIGASELLEALPLWFIEGIAEYYANDESLDPETEMLARDLVVNPNIEEGYAVLGFFADLPWSVLWTYKMGQTRAAFLEATYGKGFLQRVIDYASWLIDPPGAEEARAASIPPTDGGAVIPESEEGAQSEETDDVERAPSFEHLLQLLTGDSPQRIARRFEAWIKDRTFRTYVASAQTAPDFRPIERATERPQALASSPDGVLVMYRIIDPMTANSSLVLLNTRWPAQRIYVATDGGPGVESLHPIAGRNFALANDALAYVAQVGGRDVIYVQRIEERSRQGLELTGRVRYDLADDEIIAIEAVDFSPDGTQLAFVGTTTAGTRDVYLLTPKGGDEAEVSPLTRDIWTERDISWGPGGLVFTSDATEHRRFNLFRIVPGGDGTIERLTSEGRDHFDPLVTRDGRVLFVTFDDARANVHELVDHQIVRTTDVVTGLFDISNGPGGALWARWLDGGRFHVASVPAKAMEPRGTRELAANHSPPELPSRALVGAQPYDAMSLDEWKMGPVFGIFGAGGGDIYGQLYATANDRMRNHLLVLNVAIYGSFELTNGYFLYLNQARRTTYGGGPFQDLRYRVESTFGADRRFLAIERYFGGLVLARYPFDTFRYIEGEMSFGGVDYFLQDYERAYLSTFVDDTTGALALDRWRDLNRGVRAQGEATMRLGYDTIRYHPFTGPLDGTSILLELTATTQLEEEFFSTARLDAARYFHLSGAANFYLRGGVGSSFGGRLARQFYLSSFETIRGVPFGDTDFLLGEQFFFSTAELQFPLDNIVRIAIFPNIEGVLAMDFGGVANRFDRLWEKRVLDFALGVNFILGPLLFQLHFAKPIDTNAQPIVAGEPVASPEDWVTNFSINWLYL